MSPLLSTQHSSFDLVCSFHPERCELNCSEEDPVMFPMLLLLIAMTFSAQPGRWVEVGEAVCRNISAAVPSQPHA